MQLAQIHSRAQVGLEAPQVQVEVDLSNGLPAFNIVGMPETAVRESKDRVRSALGNAGFEFPDGRITVNLAPADLPKGGSRFDLPIALGILAASGQVQGKLLAQHEFLGELALDGGLRPIPGVLSAAREASRLGRALAVPARCAEIAARYPGARVLAAPDLLSLCAHLNGRETLDPQQAATREISLDYPDLADLVGQETPRRVLEIAAAGGHNLLLCGPPGTGKTLLASRLPGILPPADPDEALLSMALRNLGDEELSADAWRRPFRAPHHSLSSAALIGGGTRLLPGEVSLAHGGVLFLDELPEFSRHALEMLRQPLEAGRVKLSRANLKLEYPARFQLVAAMNPCPCGFLGDPERNCRCTPEQTARYQQKLSGPLLDRMDLYCRVERIAPAALLQADAGGECSAAVSARVAAARATQVARQGCDNAGLPAQALAQLLDSKLRRYLAEVARQLQLSGRAVHRTLRVSRSIADLAGKAEIAEEHLAEALAYRSDASA